ncbi:MAG: FAD-dependent oxidoreductase [Gloeobacterales cyanobacterium]
MTEGHTQIMVIGAGLSGVIAARHLAEAGLSVKVLEKSRGFGGRMATRRFRTSPIPVGIDHGAQYFTARDPKFSQFLEPFIKKGIVKVWTDGFPVIENHSLVPVPEDKRYPRYICPQGMNYLAKVLAAGLTVYLETRATRLEFTDRVWVVQTAQGTIHTADVVLSAIPAPQFLELGQVTLEQTDQGSLAKILESVHFDPSVAVMAIYGSEVLVPDWKGLIFRENPFLSWISLDSSKRGTTSSHKIPLSLVLHSTAEFARQHLEGRERAVPLLLQQAAQYVGDWVTRPIECQVQGWRYALPTHVLSQLYLETNTPGPLFWAGDWCGGPRVEGAFLSGWAAGEAILHRYV